MSKPKDLPVSRMQVLSGSGVFVKRFDRYGESRMKHYAHRDDYYIVTMLTDGSAPVEIDFERKELSSGDVLIISPWQVHNKPEDVTWHADGWMLAFAPEMLSESETRAIEEYSISPHPFHPDGSIVEDVVTLCGMLERYSDDRNVSFALASAVKSLIFSALDTPGQASSVRYRAIVLKLRKLLDAHMSHEKSPAVYASMLSISEVYLNEAVKAVTGLSAGAYIRNIVMTQAKRQLAYTSLSSKEIAYTLGYEDYAYFSRLFRKQVGKSPSEYRKNLR